MEGLASAIPKSFSTPPNYGGPRRGPRPTRCRSLTNSESFYKTMAPQDMPTESDENRENSSPDSFEENDGHGRGTTGRHIFVCRYCSLKFRHKRSLTRHTRRHTDERNYRCPDCGYCFVRSDLFQIHMKSHEYTFAVNNTLDKISPSHPLYSQDKMMHNERDSHLVFKSSVDRLRKSLNFIKHKKFGTMSYFNHDIPNMGISYPPVCNTKVPNLRLRSRKRSFKNLKGLNSHQSDDEKCAASHSSAENFDKFKPKSSSVLDDSINFALNLSSLYPTYEANGFHLPLFNRVSNPPEIGFKIPPHNNLHSKEARDLPYHTPHFIKPVGNHSIKGEPTPNFRRPKPKDTFTPKPNESAAWPPLKNNAEKFGNQFKCSYCHHIFENASIRDEHEDIHKNLIMVQNSDGTKCSPPLPKGGSDAAASTSYVPSTNGIKGTPIIQGQWPLHFYHHFRDRRRQYHNYLRWASNELLNHHHPFLGQSTFLPQKWNFEDVNFTNFPPNNTRDGTFVCKVAHCTDPLSFKGKTSLLKHLLDKHICHIFVCDICDSEFDSQEEIKTHMITQHLA